MEGLKGREVLVIDSSGHIRKLLKQLLGLLGMASVSTVNDTAEALIVLRDKSFDIVFCDESMGPLAAPEFAKALRIDTNTANVVVPLVLICSVASAQLVQVWRDSGGNDVIVKPFSAETLGTRISSLIQSPKAFVVSKSFIGPERRRTEEFLDSKFSGARDRRKTPVGERVIFPRFREGAAPEEFNNNIDGSGEC